MQPGMPFACWGSTGGVSVGLCLLCALFLAMKALRPVFTDLIVLLVHLWWWYFERCHKEWGQPAELSEGIWP